MSTPRVALIINNLRNGGGDYMLWLSWLVPSKSLEQGFPNCLASVPIKKNNNFNVPTKLF